MYNDNHRRFVQYMLQNGCASEAVALEFYRACTGGTEDLDDLQVFIAEINEKISKQSLKIAFPICEVTSSTRVALINTCSDSINQLQNSFHPAELNYFQLILKELITIDSHKLRVMNCFNLTGDSIRTLNKDHIEVLLKNFKKKGYLVQDDSYMYLGPRCIAEFTSYFQNHYQDYCTSCHLCTEIIFTGLTCFYCNKKLHKHCAKRYLSKQSRCPNCKKAWKEATESNSQDDTRDTSSSEEDS